MDFHRLSLYFLYSLTIITVVTIIMNGWDYYKLPMTERPHSDLHQDWKPSGKVSHGLGIVGSFMMLLMLLYVPRKRLRFMQRWGHIRYWLNYHIWLGVTGPILVLFHTTFKFGGIVAIAFWSMVAVVLSGVLGRYIYIQIPRSRTGQELTSVELEAMDITLREQILAEAGGDEDLLDKIQELSSQSKKDVNEFSSLWSWFILDVTMPFRLHALAKKLRTGGRLSETSIRHILSLTRKKVRLRRRVAFLDTAHKLLHHWHVFHKPFAIIMVLIMFVHTFVAIAFGYTWIF